MTRKNGLLNHCKRKCNTKTQITTTTSRLPNIFNKHFSNVGNNLASKLSPAERPCTEYLRKSKLPELSFCFKPVTRPKVKIQILSIANSKSHSLYSCPTQLLSYSSDNISLVLSNIFNTSITLGAYPKKLKMSKIIVDNETDTSD